MKRLIGGAILAATKFRNVLNYHRQSTISFKVLVNYYLRLRNRFGTRSRDRTASVFACMRAAYIDGFLPGFCLLSQQLQETRVALAEKCRVMPDTGF